MLVDIVNRGCYNKAAMNFSDLKVKKLTNILKHTPTMKKWQSKNRQTHIIGIQLCGNMYHEIGEGRLTLTENCLFFFNQKDDFCAYVKELGESYTIHFTTYEPIDTETFAVRTQNPIEAISLLEGIERAMQLQDGGENLALSGFYRFCYTLEKLSLQAYHPRDTRIANAKQYLDLHFREIGALGLAAECSGLSRRRFNDLFKGQYGITPNTYLTDLKLNAAKALLVNNSVSVKEIAELCGFEDSYYFSKLFKKHTNLTPTQFRNGSAVKK